MTHHLNHDGSPRGLLDATCRIAAGEHVLQEVTIGEVEPSFDSEWVLLGGPETDAALNAQRGKVLHHCKGRDEVCRRGLELRPKRLAILRPGRPSQGTAVVVDPARGPIFGRAALRGQSAEIGLNPALHTSGSRDDRHLDRQVRS